MRSFQEFKAYPLTATEEEVFSLFWIAADPTEDLNPSEDGGRSLAAYEALAIIGFKNPKFAGLALKALTFRRNRTSGIPPARAQELDREESLEALAG